MKTVARELKHCEVCNNTKLISVLDLGSQAVCDDLKPIGTSTNYHKFPIEILFCETCQTCHQRFQPPKQVLFPRTYHYRARNTPSVVSFLQGLAREVHEYTSISEKSFVVDIGCNDGTLLSFFSDLGATTLGVDPTDALDDCLARGHHGIKAFFDPLVAKKVVQDHGHPTHIVFTNVFAHIEDLETLCDALNILCDPNTIIIIENHYLGSILAKNQFDTFYHEHPRTYSLKSFAYIAKRLNRSITHHSFPTRYGGNIRVYLGSSTINSKTSFPPASQLPPEDFLNKLVNLSHYVSSWKSEFPTRLKAILDKYNIDSIPCKAFPGRAAILLQCLGLSSPQISAIYEIKGSLKTGYYAPGTNIPILPEKLLYESGYQGPILNLAWHLPTEVRSNLKNNGFTGDVYDIIELTEPIDE